MLYLGLIKMIAAQNERKEKKIEQKQKLDWLLKMAELDIINCFPIAVVLRTRDVSSTISSSTFYDPLSR